MTNRAGLTRLGILALWLVLLFLLIRRDVFIPSLTVREAEVIGRSREESFIGVYFQGSRIGYVKSRLTSKEGDGFQLQQDAYLQLNILDEHHPIRMHVAADLAGNFLLKGFTFSLASPFYQMAARGMAQGHEVIFSLDTGKEVVTDRIRLAAPPYLPINQRGYLLTQQLAAGDKIRVPYFDPFSLAGHDTVLEYRGKEKVLISGRIHNLHRFAETFAGIRMNSWLDDSGKVIKEESPAGFVFLAEPEFKATDVPGGGPELLRAVSVSLSAPLPPDLAGRPTMRYRLGLPEDVRLDLDGGRQQLAGAVITLHRETLPAANAAPCPGQQASLAASPYVQKDNPAIAGRGREITSEHATAAGRVRALLDWVYGNLEKRPVIGVPDAVTVLATKAGDCNEHAALFAALARSIGIPTKIVAGVAFHNNAFFYHAWNEVCLGDGWISVDAAQNQFPADLTHIRMVEGETGEMIRIGALIGQLKIIPLVGAPGTRGGTP